MKVVVFGKPRCPQCDATKRVLDRAGVQYEYRDVLASDEARQQVIDLGYTGVPVVVYSLDVSGGDEVHWSGFRPERLAELTMDGA